jgi:hypothetical protein
MAARRLIEKIAEHTNDGETRKLRGELTALRRKYEAALGELQEKDASIASLTALRGVKEKRYRSAKPKGKRPEATAVLVLSDWHCEERVDPETCRGLNSFSLEVADERVKQLVQRATMLIEHEMGLTGIRRVVVAALGDFITGHIHDDLVEMTQLAPLAATRWAQARLGGVIDSMSKIAPVLVATASGNHGRTTLKPRIATENDHSFEQHMYLTMAAQESRPNVSWQIGKGYLNLVDLDGFKLRCSHGHALRYGGGVGGLTIPSLKAVAAWNVAQRADLDVFGHWHQFLYVPYRFVSNASLIGHNAFADRIKAEYQPPSQTLVVIDHDHHRVTKVLPIFVQ